MASKSMKKLKEIKQDNATLGYVMLAVSVFLYIGVFMPTTTVPAVYMMFGTGITLLLAFAAFRRSIVAGKHLASVSEDE
ncbi:YrhC family protein [Aureibacillus halotolerans]|uniref:YrhC-like protein n=1 Tax=Aureibacillus halotolerans TaxID=1508390 RepID=A0A4R6TW14_9BACI|nr:YrhC family protein [Aureibacillus halotolerans]TDQ38020.1 YrhC-like protein [Aureibacillus halotolerans]